MENRDGDSLEKLGYSATAFPFITLHWRCDRDSLSTSTNFSKLFQVMRPCWDVVDTSSIEIEISENIEIVVTHQAEKIWTWDRTTDRTRCYI